MSREGCRWRRRRRIGVAVKHEVVVHHSRWRGRKIVVLFRRKARLSALVIARSRPAPLLLPPPLLLLLVVTTARSLMLLLTTLAAAATTDARRCRRYVAAGKLTLVLAGAVTAPARRRHVDRELMSAAGAAVLRHRAQTRLAALRQTPSSLPTAASPLPAADRIGARSIRRCYRTAGTSPAEPDAAYGKRKKMATLQDDCS